MQKNYLLRMVKSSLHSQKSTGAEKNWKNNATTYLLALFTLLGFSNAFGQVTITKPDLTVTAYCSFPTNYFPLGNIVITETNAANFTLPKDVTRTVTLTAPTNFEFNPSVGTVTIGGGGDIDSGSFAITATTITINYVSNQGNTSNNMDALTISGLQVRGINTASTGNITRTGGDGLVSGLVNSTTLTNTLTSVLSLATPNITINPVNATINSGTNTAFTASASNNPSSYIWEVSTDGGATWAAVTNGGVYSGATTATLNLTAVPFTMNGYRYRTRATNGCGTSSNSSVALLTVNLAYCTSSGGTVADGITGVNFNTINNLGTSVTTAYQDFTAISTNILKGSSYNLNVYINTGGNFTNYQSVYIDWNGDGDFIDAGEFYNIGTATNVVNGLSSLSPLSITVPIGAITGAVRMRIQSRYNSVTTGPCQTGFDGEVEDYTINILNPAPCVAPTAQPTALNLTPAGSTISGGFVAASPAANSYLVVISTSATPPTAPSNGTSYTIGGTLAPGYTIVDNDTNTTFTATGLTPLTTYYIYIYSFNNLCSGGPLYLGTSPLTGTTTTTSTDYCIPTIGAAYATSTSHHIRKVEFIGTLQDIVNTSTFTSVAPIGYENYTGLAVKSIQAKGEGVNIYMESPSSGFIKAWVDWNMDGDFVDAGETVYDAGGTSQASTTLGFIVPTTIPTGDYRVRLRISGRNAATPGADAGFSWNACTTNLAYFGETEDYILRVVENCAAKITSITNGEVCGSGSATLNVTATAGTTAFRWYSAQTGGTLLATTATGTWNTPSISTTTTYWVTAFNGSCETLVRTKIIAFAKTVPTLTFATSNTEVCGENSIVALTAGGDTEVIHLINENFESGMGAFSNVHYVNNAAVNAQTAWQIRTGPYVPTGLTWYPAISSNFGANNFAFVNSDVGTYTAPPASTTYYYIIDNGLVSNAVNTTGFLDLTFKFRVYFDRYYPNAFNPADELMTVDVSTNGGGTWTSLSGNISNDIGYGTRFTDYSYNLAAYINQPNLRVRIRYYTSTWANGAAVDDVELFGTKALNTAFQWSGTSLPDVYTDPTATTTPYVAGTPVSTVYVKPNLAQLENGSYTFTATATLTNGCNVSQNITITNKSNIWKGNVNNDWNNPANWSPAIVPDANSCVIIPTAPSSSNIIGTNYNAFGKTLIVKNGGRLDIQPNNTLTIGDGVTVDAGGTFNIENSASLIQVNNIANTGNITMKRNVNLRKLDYVYWSSPVANFGLNNISTTTYRYKWLPTIGTNTNGWGNWQVANEIMTLGKGYIVRGPDNFTSTLQNYTQNFVGVPNNGTINMPISRGTYDGINYSTGVSTTLATKDDDNWNLLGNPYPSAINANTFLATNTNIAGFIKYWTHGTLPSAVISDPFYSNYGQNYTVGDYVTYNATGANPAIGNGNIAAGQGFFVLMNHTSAATTENVVFNNTMRRNDYRNDLFYRDSIETNIGVGEGEKHRIWLNLISPSATSSTTLIGYINGATNTIDRMFDAPALDVKTNFELYSFSNTDKLNIQGKALPFDSNDQIPLGISISQNGIHTIGISTVDGLFENSAQNIYLEDRILGIIHDLRTTPYSFTGSIGRYENRFVLKFNNETLGNEDFITNSVTVYTNEQIHVNAPNQTIKSVKIYDLLGRVLGTFNNVNASTFASNTVAKTQSALLVEVTLENGATKTYKVIF